MGKLKLRESKWHAQGQRPHSVLDHLTLTSQLQRGHPQFTKPTRNLPKRSVIWSYWLFSGNWCCIYIQVAHLILLDFPTNHGGNHFFKEERRLQVVRVTLPWFIQGNGSFWNRPACRVVRWGAQIPPTPQVIASSVFVKPNSQIEWGRVCGGGV